MQNLSVSGCGNSRSFNRRAWRLFASAVLVGIGATGASPAMAASTWTGPGGSTAAPTSGNWNAAGDWSPVGVPASSPTTELDFLGSTTYTATDDIAGAFSLNILKVNANGSSIAAIAGNSLLFNGSNPTINQLGTGIFTIAAPVGLAANTSVSQANGGELDFTAAVTSSSSLTLNNSSATGNSIVKFTGANTFNGLTVNSHVTAQSGLSANSTTLGSGAVMLAGGTLMLQGRQSAAGAPVDQAIGVTGFSGDTIDDAAGGPSTSSAGVALDVIDGGNLNFQNGFRGDQNGVPSTGIITSAYNGSAAALNGTFTQFKLGYNGTSIDLAHKNTLYFANTSSQSLTLATPAQASTLQFLAQSQAVTSIDVQLNFSNGTTSNYTAAITTGPWASFTSGNASNIAYNAPDILNRGGNTFGGFNSQLTESDITLSTADAAKTISSIQFTPESLNGGVSAEVYAVSGDVFGSQVTLGTQAYSNNVVVTADSSIDVSGSLTATLGNLSIGGNKLSVTSSDPTTAAYSLSLGAVTLTGTTATSFDVAASTGGGAGTLTLGALNDGGTARTITFNPAGTGSIVLSTDASSLVSGTVMNVLNGTLYSNTNASIGTFATVNLSAPGTLNLAAGTQQQISALNGSGGTVNLVASGTNGKNTGLTIGNTDNLSSSYAGVIAGSGIVTKVGSGTVTLSGPSTFAGSATVNSNGSLIQSSMVINGGTVVAGGPSVVTNFGNITSGPLGTAAIIVNSGATGTNSSIYLDGTPGRTLANPIYIGSSGPAVPTLAALNTTGVTAYSGSITLGTGSTGDFGHSLAIAATNGGEVDFTGNILANAGTGHSDITVNNLSGTGNATVRFTGSNTYAGGTTVNPNVTLAAGPSASTTPFGTNTVHLAGGNVALRGIFQNTQQTVAVTGFNADTILDPAATTGTNSSTGTATSNIDGNYLFYATGYKGSTSNGLPANGTITSASTGHLFQLGDLTANNTLQFRAAGASQTLTLGTAAAFQTLDFLATSNNTATYRVTLNFTDSSNDSIGTFTTNDWYGGRVGFNAVTGLNPAFRATGAITNYGGNLTLQEYDASIPLADQSKSISSITVTATNVTGASGDIYAISGTATASTTPLGTQTLANNFTVTANSGIDVSGSLAATIGTLAIGGNQLSITSADTTTSSYSLTTGAVTFNGQAPSFNVSNSAGGGPGTLILGSLNDHGAKQLLTKLGAGTLALNSPATQVTDTSVYTIAGGTLASNDANALTYTDAGSRLNLVGIAIASGATFSIGASQAIDSLNDSGTPVISGSTVALNGYNLSIGSVHDRNSTFSGKITDGTGTASGLVKNGGGTLTLAGASTYSGNTAVNFGTLLVSNSTGSATGGGNVTLNQSVLASGAVGTIAGNVLSGNTYYTIAPGGIGSIGTLNVGGLTTSFYTTLNFDLGTGTGIVTNGDLLNLGSGTVSIPNGTVITFGTNPATNGIDYRLIGGSISSINLSHFTLPTAPSGTSYSLSNTVDPGFIDLVVAAANVSLIWNNSLTNTTPPGDGVTWANFTGAPGDTSQNFLANNTPSGFTTGNAVTFNDNNNGHYNVNIASNVLPASVTVASSGNYTFGSTGGFAIGDVPSGTTTLTQSGGGSLTISNVNTFTGATNVSGSGTTLHLTSTGSLKTASLTVGASATANVDGLLTNSPAVVDNGTINLGASDVNNDPTAGFLTRTWGSLTIGTGATVSIKPATSTSTRTLLITSSLANSGKIDLSSNDMIVHGANMGTVATVGSIANQIQSAYNNGAWNGSTGITSSTAATKRLNALGYAPGGSTFDSTSTTSTDVLIKYTYYGDANLDGKVDASDYSRIDSGFLTHATGWYNGDFNYDGVINGSDYTLIDNAFNTQGATLAAEIASPTAQISGSSSTSAVPEPASIGMLLAGSAGLLGRRRRRN